MTEEIKIKNLPILQNKIKKDPSLYESDVRIQNLNIFLLNLVKIIFMHFNREFKATILFDYISI